MEITILFYLSPPTCRGQVGLEEGSNELLWEYNGEFAVRTVRGFPKNGVYWRWSAVESRCISNVALFESICMISGMSRTKNPLLGATKTHLPGPDVGLATVLKVKVEEH